MPTLTNGGLLHWARKPRPYGDILHWARKPRPYREIQFKIQNLKFLSPTTCHIPHTPLPSRPNIQSMSG